MQDVEKKLSEVTDEVEGINVPDQVNQYIWQGIDRGKREQRKKHRVLYSSVAAIAAFLIFFSSIRLSPAFAAACVKNIPGMDYIVNLIQNDRGLEAAINNNFMQNLNLSQSKNGTIFTIDRMVADQNQMILFYTIHRRDVSTDINPRNLVFKNNKGESVAGSTEFDYTNDSKGKTTIHDRITVTFNQKQLTNPLHYSMNLANTKWDFTIPFNIEKYKKMKKVYPVNETVSMDGQKMTFDKVRVYPTRVAINVQFDPNNTKQITRFEDIRLVDGNGSTWASINNGIVASNISNNEWIVYLQSNYFSNPKSLYLKLNSARAINKNERKVVADLNKKKILNGPSDGRLTLSNVKKQKNGLFVDFSLVRPKIDLQRHYQYSLFNWEFTDATGKTYSFHSVGTSTENNKNRVVHHIVQLPLKNYKSPLIFTLDDYPTRIHGNVSIKLK